MDQHLCAKCAAQMKLVRDVNKVSFSRRKYMYAAFRCPECGLEESFPVAEYHLISGEGFLCPRCSPTIQPGGPSVGEPEELARRAKGTTIEIDNRCKTCGLQWTTRVEWYRPKIPGLRF
jgi:DNA-directed RNA polymerase subunit RPC12/RpoP